MSLNTEIQTLIELAKIASTGSGNKIRPRMSSELIKKRLKQKHKHVATGTYAISRKSAAVLVEDPSVILVQRLVKSFPKIRKALLISSPKTRAEAAVSLNLFSDVFKRINFDIEHIRPTHRGQIVKGVEYIKSEVNTYKSVISDGIKDSELSPLEQLSKKILSFGTLKANWTSYNSATIKKEAILKAYGFLRDDAASLATYAVFVAPTVDGGVFIDYKKEERRVSVIFRSNGSTECRVQQNGSAELTSTNQYLKFLKEQLQ